MKKRVMLAVFFGILLGAFVAFANPPPAIAHHQPAAVYGSMTAKGPVVVADQVFTLHADIVAVAEWPTVVYLAATRPDGSGKELALSPGIAKLNFERRVGIPDIAVFRQHFGIHLATEKGFAHLPTTAIFSAQGGDSKVFFAGLRPGFAALVMPA